MEGLAEDALRAVLTSGGAFDWCVTEFVRITDTLLPLAYFSRISPELACGARTPAGTPVRLQLLGSDPEMLALNAARAASLDPFGIDLNFGCPAPTVNRNRGGAALLEEPELLCRILTAVRAAVAPELPVTAKMRLGIQDTHFALDCALALAQGGASELVVHGRTKRDGYRPPARWDWIARIREAVTIPVIANGEVWNVADYHAIRGASGCRDVMIGRGAVADPLLAQRIRASLAGQVEADDSAAADWRQLQAMIGEFWQRFQRKAPAPHAAGRLKQWLALLRRHYPASQALFQAIRPLSDNADVDQVLKRHGIGVGN